MGSRLEILARVRQLGAVLEKKDVELADICGVTSQQWSNYRSIEHNNEIPVKVAIILWNAYGIPLEWIFDGQTSRIPDPEMREKLTFANRRAAEWIASQSNKRRPSGNMARIAILVTAGVFYFWHGTDGGQAWQRTSGAPIALQQEVADRLACRGEARERLQQGDNEADWAVVYLGCMSEHGYVPKGEWYK